MSRYLAPIIALAATFVALVGASGSAATKPQKCNSKSPNSSCPPVNTSPPTITGTPTQGQTLSGGTGSWDGTPPIALAYEWRRCDTNGANCISIPGATSQSYTPVASDVGSTIRLTVTATNGVGYSLADSSATQPVSPPTGLPAPSPPSDTTPPSISGTAMVGQTLTASPGSWGGTAPITYAYQWKRCDANGANCASISGANGPSYALVSSDVGARLRVSVTASNSAGRNSADSAPTPTVSAAPADTQPPTQPGGFAVTATTATSISVSWSASNDNVGIAGYHLYLNGSSKSTVTGTSYTFSGLSCGASYTLAVDAYDAAGNLSPKTSLTASTGACWTPSDPSCDKVAQPGLGTAQALLDSLATGQTGCLHGGNYTGSPYVLNFKPGRSGVTIVSYPGETATLNGIVEDKNGADNNTLDDVTIAGDGSQNTVHVYGSQFTLSNSTITNDGRGPSCLMLGNHSYGEAISPTVTGNTFHDCGSAADGTLDHAIYDCWSQDARITNNVFYRSQAYAIQLYPDAHGTVFDHNTIDGGDQSTRGGVVFAGDSGYASTDNTVSNNVIAYAATYNLTSSWGGSTGSGNTANGNCLWGGVLGNINPGLSGVTLSANLIADPLFTNRSARDYRLQPGSPCAGKGAG